MTASPVLTVSCRATWELALRLMRQTAAAPVRVTDAVDKLVGLVTSGTIAGMMTLAMLQKDRAGGGSLAWRSRPSGMRLSHRYPRDQHASANKPASLMAVFVVDPKENPLSVLERKQKFFKVQHI
jgi:CBS-domain-containing membrane protein